MADLEVGMIVELPMNMGSGPFLTPVRGGKRPLEILYQRLEKIVPLKDMVFLAGHDDAHIPYGNFMAERGLFLFRTDEPCISTQLMRAAAARRMRTVVRVNACHTFADPEFLREMLDLHKRIKAAHTYMEGAPAWLGGEIFSGGELIDAHIIAERENRPGEQPGGILRSMKEQFLIGTYRPAVPRRWKSLNISLAEQSSAALLIEAVRRARDPLAVTYRDFLE
jgi:spore coat polysaccharide biosynthesis protein SpsF (cytidylyltransferase family)